MAGFFIEDEFHEDIDSLVHSMGLDEEEFFELDSDWKVEAVEANLEKIFVLNKEDLINAIYQKIEELHSDSERFPDSECDFDNTLKSIKNAITQSIDVDKLNSLLPGLWYPTKKKIVITKADLAEYVS
jgi:Ni2+-binding GTPase involved in maturation of urease and hydrogenase